MSRRVFMAVLVVLVGCTGSTHAAPATPAKEIMVQQVDNRAPTSVVLTSKPVRIPTASRHSAFPSIAQAPDGTLTMVWRGGTDHADSRDGSIYRATSSNQGQTWTGVVRVPLPVGHDYRDPSISYVGGHEYLTFFTGANGTAEDAAQGAYVSRDGGPPVRIDPGYPRAAISAPVVQLPDGRLATAFYGWKAGESLDTAFMAWSSDLGSSWSTNRILNDGTPHPEPVLLIRNGVVHLLARGGGDTIVMRSSTNSGASGSWDSPHVIVGACTGRPSAIVTAAGTMVMVCRGILPSLNAQVAYSVNGGQKWWWGPTIQASAGGIGMTYAAMWEERPGTVVEVGGMEAADGSSSLAVAGLAESIG